jgi:hypothetical protein
MAAVAKVIKGENHQFIPLSDNIVLQTGNLIKFYFEFEKEAFLYIFHEDSRGALTLLFPKDPQSPKVSQYAPVYIPEGNSWLELDSNTGKETFHLLVSAIQLEGLEKLYNRHNMLKEKDAIKQSVQAILTEIKSLRRENLRTQAERPQMVAGKLRGKSNDGSLTPQELRDAATEVTATGTYVNSVTIDHK